MATRTKTPKEKKGGKDKKAKKITQTEADEEVAWGLVEEDLERGVAEEEAVDDGEGPPPGASAGPALASDATVGVKDEPGSEEQAPPGASPRLDKAGPTEAAGGVKAAHAGPDFKEAPKVFTVQGRAAPHEVKLPLTCPTCRGMCSHWVFHTEEEARAHLAREPHLTRTTCWLNDNPTLPQEVKSALLDMCTYVDSPQGLDPFELADKLARHHADAPSSAARMPPPASPATPRIKKSRSEHSLEPSASPATPVPRGKAKGPGPYDAAGQASGGSKATPKAGATAPALLGARSHFSSDGKTCEAQAGKRRREEENMAALLSDYVEAHSKKLARSRSDNHLNVFRITWENVHTLFGKESEFPCPAVCEICPKNSRNGRYPDLPNQAVGERHLTGGDHLASLSKRAEQLKSKSSSNQRALFLSGGGRQPSRAKLFPCPLFGCQGWAEHGENDVAARCVVCNAKVALPR